VKLEAFDALGVPVKPIAGAQPFEFSLPLQYVDVEQYNTEPGQLESHVGPAPEGLKSPLLPVGDHSYTDAPCPSSALQ
jgi:hypothetical protein